ncbi:sporulation membrane protein YtrI [Bacillus marasmi]|uniref:sporulation membrane protein YtrI n=1 Tax=Bacillus marasmi TaxID=1926279 RepID=UPI0011C8B0BB|nr:sporulation membrane protein YtrI [Bacillus marasmi]
MRIPPYYHKPSWQVFFSGMAIGGLVCWGIFLYIFGVWQEKQSEEIQKQKDIIKELTAEKNIWQDEFRELNKRNLEKMTVQEIKIEVTNYKKYDLDLLSVYEVEDGIKEDINMVLAKEIETVYESREMLRRAIENKVVKVNDKRYRLEIREIFIYTTLSIKVEMHLD